MSSIEGEGDIALPAFPKDKPIIDREFMIELKEIIGHCEYPRCNVRVGLHCHHIHGRGFGGGKRKDTPEELIILCREHHNLVHAQGLSKAVQKVCYDQVAKRPDHETKEIHAFYRRRS